MTTSTGDPLLQSTIVGQQFQKLLNAHRLLQRQWLHEALRAAHSLGDQADALALTELIEVYG